MEFHGKFSMELHGILSGFGTWNSTEFHGVPWKIFHGTPWNSVWVWDMEFHGIPWSSMENFPWNSMEDFPWNSMEFCLGLGHGIPWKSMEVFFFFHGIPGNSMEFHGGFSSHGIS